MGKKKVSVTLDQQLLESIDRISKEKKMSKSRVIEEMLRDREKMLLRERLREGYVAMREEDRRLAEETIEAQKEVIDE